MIDKLEVEISADTKPAVDDIKGLEKRLKDPIALAISMDFAKLKAQERELKARLRKAIKDGDKEAEITVTADLKILSKQLQQSNRELQNYSRTGQKDLSVLGIQFNRIQDEIKQSRAELIKLGKSTSVINKFDRDLENLTKELNSGKISIKQYKAEIDKINAKLTNAGGIFNKLKQSVKQFGVALIAGFSVQVIASFTKQAVLNFAKFEKGLARINTVANVSKKQMEGLGDEVKNISAQYGIAQTELLETGFNISSAGVEFENVSKIMKLSAITAIGASTDTTTAFNGIIAVVKKYGENLNEAGNIAEKFFIANKLGQTTIADMANAMQNLTSSVKPAGVSMNEVFAILATATGVTGDANKVITQLNGAINALAAPTTEASAKFKELGIEVGQSAIKEKGFVTVAKEVYDAVGGNQEQLRKLIPEIEASKLIVALATTQNTKYKESLDEVTNSSGNLEEAVKKMTETTDFQLKVASSKWANFTTSVGNFMVILGGILVDFGRDVKNVALSIFSLVKVVGHTFQGALTILGGFGLKTKEFLSNAGENFKIFGQNIPIYVKQGLNQLSGLVAKAVKAMIAELPGGDVLIGKFGLTGKGTKLFSDTQVKGYVGSFDTISNGIDITLGEIGDNIDKEFGNISNRFGAKSKEFQSETAKLLNSLKDIDQSFGDTSDNKLEKELEKITKASGGASKSIDKLAKSTEELTKITEDVYGDIEKEIEDSEKALEDYSDKILETGEAFEDLAKEAKDSIRDINDELKDLGTKDIEIKAKGEKDLAKRLIDIEGELGEAEGEEKVKLEEEKLFIQKQVSEGIIQQVRDYENLSEAQKIALEIEKERGEVSNQKAILEERKAILGTIEKEASLKAKLAQAEAGLGKANETKDLEARKKANEEILAIEEELANLQAEGQIEAKFEENQRFLEDLELKKANLDLEFAQLQEARQLEVDLLRETNIQKQLLEEQYTKFFGEQLAERERMVEKLNSDLRETIRLMSQAGMNTGGGGNTTNNTTNNSRGDTIINNAVDFESHLRELNNDI